MKKKQAVICPYCNNHAKLVKGGDIYPKRSDLHSKFFYNCEPCGARVGCHGKTKKPLGRLANTQLRFWKIQAHNAFDPIWKHGGKDRNMAYDWLARQLGIDKSKCHIGMFDVDMCKKVVEVCS